MNINVAAKIINQLSKVEHVTAQYYDEADSELVSLPNDQVFMAHHRADTLEIRFDQELIMWLDSNYHLHFENGELHPSWLPTLVSVINVLDEILL